MSSLQLGFPKIKILDYEIKFVIFNSYGKEPY